VATVWNPQVARAFVEMSHDGRPFGCNLHFLRAGGWGTSELSSLAGALNLAWDNHIMPLLSSLVNQDGVRAYDLSGPNGPVVFTPISQPAPGGIAADLHSLSVAVVFTLRTASRGRSGRGRFYVSGLAESEVSEGALTTAANISWEAAGNAFLAALTTAGLTLCVYSTEQGGIPLTQGDPITVTDIELRTPILGNQRRRNPRP
jgi:hypothetical protein